jgi:hypothetical protein
MAVAATCKTTRSPSNDVMAVTGQRVSRLTHHVGRVLRNDASVRRWEHRASQSSCRFRRGAAMTASRRSKPLEVPLAAVHPDQELAAGWAGCLLSLRPKCTAVSQSSRPGVAVAPQDRGDRVCQARTGLLLGLGGQRDAEADRLPDRGSPGADPAVPAALHPSVHREAGAAAARRPVQNRWGAPGTY